MAPCTQRVKEAGCAIEPFGNDGPLSVVPLTSAQLTESEMVLSCDRVLLLISEIELLKAALKEFNCKGAVRPKLDVVHLEDKHGLADVEAVGAFCAQTNSDMDFPIYRPAS